MIDGIAVIPVQGTLLKRESFMSAWSGSSSCEQIQRQMASAVADAGVSAILLDIDSPGGETAGCFDIGRLHLFRAEGEAGLGCGPTISPCRRRMPSPVRRARFGSTAPARSVPSASMRCTWTSRASTRIWASSTRMCSRATASGCQPAPAALGSGANGHPGRG